MTAPTTQRDLRSPVNGRVPEVDSPAVRAQARASIPVTKSDAKRKRLRFSFQPKMPAWTARPDSLAGTWAASAVDGRRIPNTSRAFRALWTISNFTDRLIMFALILIAPTLLTGPLRHLAQRPTRRYGLYLTVLALTITLLIGRN